MAISGAMPGIVGAMMRIGSPYAPMRESITERDKDITVTGKPVFVKLKLFNVILKDLGGGFIFSGITLDSGDILRIIKKIETMHCSVFSFTVDGLSLNSSETGGFSDEKYIIRTINR